MAGSSAHTVRAGTLLLAAAPRCPFTPDGERDFEAHLLSFDRSILFEEPAHLFERLHEQDKLLYWPPPLSPAVSGIFRQLETLRDLPEGECRSMARLLLSQLLVLLGLHCQQQAEEALGIRVMRYVDRHYTTPFSLEQLARQFFVSKYYLCRAFKASSGTSVHAYVCRRRVQLARELMASGMTASVAAYRVGFGDYSSFYRTYKKMTGHAPSADKES